jgi:hypothetical protein
VASGEFVRLKCQPGTLEALAARLTAFGATNGAPDWLVSGVWLCTEDTQYLATASVTVLKDGFVARSLCIVTPEDLSEHLEAELPDIAARLRARGNEINLPDARHLPRPVSLSPWPRRDYAMSVLVRSSRPDAEANRVTCALLFKTERRPRLLIGTDPSMLAMVLSEDDELIERYREGCEELSTSDYLALA